MSQISLAELHNNERFVIRLPIDFEQTIEFWYIKIGICVEGIICKHECTQAIFEGTLGPDIARNGVLSENILHSLVDKEEIVKYSYVLLDPNTLVQFVKGPTDS